METTNKITELFKNLPDADLKLACREVKKKHHTGVRVNGGFVDDIAKKVAKICENKEVSAFFYLVETSILSEAAYRYSGCSLINFKEEV